MDTGTAWQDGPVAQMRRRDPEPPPGPPRIEFKPGIAKEMLRELVRRTSLERLARRICYWMQ